MSVPHSDGILNVTNSVNDDEAERREFRRRTLIRQLTPRYQEGSLVESVESNETIRKCIEIYNENKLSRDNAWSLALIDTLSSVLDRHHNKLSNFRVCHIYIQIFLQ